MSENNTQTREEWIKELKVDDIVCVTNKNTNALFEAMFSSIMSDQEKQESTVCSLQKVRGFLNDGSIVVGDSIYDGTTGKITGGVKTYSDIKLDIPTEEYRLLRERLDLIHAVPKLPWMKFSDDSIHKIKILIFEEVKRIESEKCDIKNQIFTIMK